MLVIYVGEMVSKAIRQPYKITPITGFDFFFGMSMPKLGITSFHGMGGCLHGHCCKCSQRMGRMVPKGSPLGLQETGYGFAGKSITEEILKNREPTKSGWISMSFNDGTELGISAEELGQTELPFIPSIALGMLPPRVPAIASAEWVWRPAGWPEDIPLPEEGVEEVEHALNEWMSSRIVDGSIAEICRRRILSSINEGFLSRNIWFSEDDRKGFLESLEGSEIEREALSIILDNLEEGVL